MAHKLADETLADILARHLHITDGDFDTLNPYRRHLDPGWRTSSDVLLVCKRWMRVATPLLYTDAILRSTAQAQSLFAALKATRALGAFIRRLRVEGGYGMVMHKIISLAPNISHLVLNLQIWGDDNSKGLCKALPEMNPSSLVLVYLDRKRYWAKENANTRNLRQAIETCLPEWSNLLRISVNSGVELEDGDGILCKKIASAPNLRHIHLRGRFQLNTIQLLAAAPSLQTITLHSSHLFDGSKTIVDELPLKDPRLAEKVVRVELPGYQETSIFEPVATDSAVQHRRDFVPLRNCSPDIRLRIWSRIFSYAMHQKALDPFYSIDSDLLLMALNPAAGLLTRKQRLMLVCKEFLVIVQELCCHTLWLKTPDSVIHFTRLIAKRPDFASRVKTVHLSTDNAEPCYQALQALFKATHLRSFQSQCTLPRPLWNELVVASGSSLIKLSLNDHEYTPSIEGARQSPFDFTAFPALEELACGLSGDDIPTASSSEALESLGLIDLTSWSPDFISLLSRLKLSSLRELKLQAHVFSPYPRQLDDFLTTHGSKLRTVILEGPPVHHVLTYCPNLTRLDISHWPAAGYLDKPHGKLEVVSFSSTPGAVRESWKDFFESFDAAQYPALREISIEHESFHQGWPTDERSVAKSPWTAYGERMMAHNIAIVDRSAGPWRPRLKLAPKARKARKTD